jgi:hypothetical protein
MGSNRGISKEQSPPEVFGRLSNSFSDNDKKELFAIWQSYNEMRIGGVNPFEIVKYFRGDSLDYFTAVGFELFNKEYIKLMEEDSENNYSKIQ